MKKLIIILSIAGLLYSCEKAPLKDNPEVTLKSLSIQTDIDNAVSGDNLVIMPGLYTEQLTLKDGVDLEFMEGAKVQWMDGVVLTDGSPVVCNITGHGVFDNGESWNQTVRFTNSSSVITFEYDSVLNSGIEITGGTVTLINGYIGSLRNIGLNTGTYGKEDTLDVVINGGVVSVWGDYGISNAGLLVANDVTVYSIAGQYGCNSAISSYGGLDALFEFSGYAVATNNFGAEIGGGTFYFHDCVLESQSPPEDYNLADALSAYGGNEIIFGSNVTLLASPNVDVGAFSIGNQYNPYGGTTEINVNDYVYYNKVYVSDTCLTPYGGYATNLNWGVGKELVVMLREPLTNLTYLKEWGKEKYNQLFWDGDGSYDVWIDGVYNSTVNQEMFIHYLTPPPTDIEYTIYYEGMTTGGISIIVPKK